MAIYFTSDWHFNESRIGDININLVVGIEDGFTNHRYIKRRFSQDCPNISICSTLEETCKSSVELIRI